MSVPIAVLSIAQVRTRLAAVASESTAAAPPIPHIRMWGVLRSAHARCCRHGRSGLARPFATHISTARPQCRLLTTATVPILRRDGEEEELAPGFSQKVGAAAAYGPMVDSLRYGENLIVHPFHPKHPYYWRGGRARLVRNVACSLLRRAPGSFQEVVEEARDTSMGGKGVGKI